MALYVTRPMRDELRTGRGVCNVWFMTKEQSTLPLYGSLVTEASGGRTYTQPTNRPLYQNDMRARGFLQMHVKVRKMDVDGGLYNMAPQKQVGLSNLH